MSKNSSNKALQRTQIDKRLKQLRKLNLTQPSSGWIRAIRTSLGMSATQLAKRLNVTPQTVKDYENAEEAGTISVATLKKVANAMECDPQVLLVPRDSLETIVKNQALKAAKKIVGHADIQMNLEAQGTAKDFKQKQIKEMAEEIARDMSKELWEE